MSSSSMEVFCKEICTYFEKNYDENMLISLIIRDIYLNDIGDYNNDDN